MRRGTIPGDGRRWRAGRSRSERPPARAACPAEVIEARLRATLRWHYDSVLTEPVPEDMLELARALGALPEG